MRTWDDVEGECPGISLRAWHSSTVHPYIIITLRQATNHHEFIIDEAHAWHSAYHFTRIRILSTRYFLCRNIAHDDGTVFGHLYHCRIRITPFHCGNGHLVQLLFIRLQSDGQQCFLRSIILRGSILRRNDCLSIYPLSALQLNPVNFLSFVSYIFYI